MKKDIIVIKISFEKSSKRLSIISTVQKPSATKQKQTKDVSAM